MFDSNGNVTSSVIGGYSLQSRLDEVSIKLANVERRIHELEAMIGTGILSPIEVIDFNNMEQDSENSQSTTFERENNYPTGVRFVVSIPAKLLAEFNNNLDMEYSLRVCKRGLSDKAEEMKKNKGIDEQDLKTCYVI